MSVQFRSVTLFALESIWWWRLIVDQFAASSILVKGALHYWKTSGWTARSAADRIGRKKGESEWNTAKLENGWR